MSDETEITGKWKSIIKGVLQTYYRRCSTSGETANAILERLKPERDLEICRVLDELQHGAVLADFSIGDKVDLKCAVKAKRIDDMIDKYSPTQYCKWMQEAIDKKWIEIINDKYYMRDHISGGHTFEYSEFERCPFCQDGENCLKKKEEKPNPNIKAPKYRTMTEGFKPKGEHNG